MIIEKKTMRDAFIEQIYHRMHEDSGIFFLTADFGSPVLDRLKRKFEDRFINVGIAEQNLINVSTGLALEGYPVYAYAHSAIPDNEGIRADKGKPVFTRSTERDKCKFNRSWGWFKL